MPAGEVDGAVPLPMAMTPTADVPQDNALKPILLALLIIRRVRPLVLPDGVVEKASTDGNEVELTVPMVSIDPVMLATDVADVPLVAANAIAPRPSPA